MKEKIRIQQIQTFIAREGEKLIEQKWFSRAVRPNNLTNIMIKGDSKQVGKNKKKKKKEEEEKKDNLYYLDTIS